MSPSHIPGKLFTVAAPSGTGKTSLVKALLERMDTVSVSISYTTRPKRPGETHGVNYFFVEKDVFEAMIARGEFLEHAKVFNNYYGTAKAQVEKELASGKHVILEIDWQGVAQIHAQFPTCQRIFILPPSIEDLEKRLFHRAQDNEDIIRERLNKASEEMSHAIESDYILVNDCFKTTLSGLESIMRGDYEETIEHRAMVKKLLS
jgi:guanylate kinase